jgi:arsenate reductase
MRLRLVRTLVPVLLMVPATPSLAGDDLGPLVRSLWLVQRHGTAEAVAPQNDQTTKGRLSKALGKDGILTATGVKGLMDPSVFDKLAGEDGRLDPSEIRSLVESDRPESRKRLAPKVAAHADFLTTSFDMIDEPHRDAGQRLVDWIAENYRPGQPLHVTVICTGNSRRSILGATMGNVAAAYYGLPEVRFHSGGPPPEPSTPARSPASRTSASRSSRPARRRLVGSRGRPTRSTRSAGARAWRRPSSRRPTMTPAIRRRASPP